MDRLALCHNAFDHDAASSGSTTEVGEVLRLAPEEAERLTGARLVRPLGGPPEAVAGGDIFEGPGEGEASTMIHHKGGGWYLVADSGGHVLAGDNPVQGASKARKKAKAHARRVADSSDDS